MKRSIIGMLAFLFCALPSLARAEGDQQEAVDSAYVVVETLQNAPEPGNNVRNLLHNARGILIVPELVKGGFIFGAQGGTGVLLARDAQGSWSDPAFFGMGAASFGFQIGLEESKIILIIMSEKAMQAVMRDEFKIGAEAGIAVATVGGGAEADTTTHGGADIYAFSESKGLFGGVAIEGGIMKPRRNYNEAYYGKPVSTQEIVLKRVVSNPGADRLRNELQQISSGK